MTLLSSMQTNQTTSALSILSRRRTHLISSSFTCRNYYERILKLLRPGGLIAIDNVLWDGKVAATTIDPADEKTMAIVELNKFIAADQRVEISMVPVADGVTLCWKKPQQP